MDSVRPTLFVTGIALHSLGERFLSIYLEHEPTAKVIGADLDPTPLSHPRLATFSFDLNPLTCNSGYEGFATALRVALSGGLDRMRERSINCVVQSTGVYDFGRFLEHGVARRVRTLGVNLLGHIETLHAVMSLNAACGFDNSAILTSIDIGSFQGLYARAERPVYAPSKAAGIDFAGALFEGKEVARSLYFAPASIDTHMLHFNHWVKKAGGSEKLFSNVRGGDRHQYDAIFMRCDQRVLRNVAAACGLDPAEAEQTMLKYAEARKGAFAGSLGVLRVDTCARMLTALVRNPDHYPSGVYLAFAPYGAAPRLTEAGFRELSRLKLIEAIGRSEEWREE